MSSLVEIILAEDPVLRNRSLEIALEGMNQEELKQACTALDQFRRKCTNLYERVRALFFLYAIHRFHLPKLYQPGQGGLLPFDGSERVLNRRFEEGIDHMLQRIDVEGWNDTLSSALAYSYYQLGLQNLTNQVRRSVRSVRGNQWMFRMGHPTNHPLRIRSELVHRASQDRPYPVIHETTPVRLDLTHSGWSDIFFLGMDFPEAARVLNISVNLGVLGRDKEPRPPLEAFFRIIDEPVIRLVSIDLGATADVDTLDDIFNFGKDYLGLLKAAVIAAGIIPPGIEGSGMPLASVLENLIGSGKGFELVSHVRDIPKGSRLAVSTNLLACLITACMRATGQTKALVGTLAEPERRVVAARAILGEWLGGSGGGWQDSGGVWPGIKTIHGEPAGEGDPEFGISRGCLLPRHRVLNTEVSEATIQALQNSLVLVHGGMAQNVGPILEMVTEKYLLRSQPEWDGRLMAMDLFENIVDCLKAGDIKALASLTTKNFYEPLQTIIPWASTFYTEQLIQRISDALGDGYWGFLMLGGMSGSGMGFFVDPVVKERACSMIQDILLKTKRELEYSLPFAMDPVVYDFTINAHGTYGSFLTGHAAILPPVYYKQVIPRLVTGNRRALSSDRIAELHLFSKACDEQQAFREAVPQFFKQLLPDTDQGQAGADDLESLLEENGFDSVQHEAIRQSLQAGRIGLSQNRLSANSIIEDVKEGDVFQALRGLGDPFTRVGKAALEGGEVGVITLAAGVGSRWTEGAGVVKGLHPFCKLSGRHRSFIETHLAKSGKVAQTYGAAPIHVVTTSYLTHAPIQAYMDRTQNFGYEGDVYISKGQYIGLRMIPFVRDLRFAWENQTEQILDERAQKMRENVREALIQWTRNQGEGSDYRDNLPLQCLHPVGHWYEIPNLIRNGTLAAMLAQRPQLKYLLLHNIDTVGTNLDAGLLGVHIDSGADFSFEVITRRFEDRGGGLARVDDRFRLVEGLCLPREEDEYALTYYNTLTTWISVEGLLRLFKLTREDLSNEDVMVARIREFAARMPTYITIKEVKKRWGHAQEDIYPVCQFEKLWGDMSSLRDAHCAFMAVPRLRGQQLKAQAQLDGWLRDGSAAHLESLCVFKQ